MKFLCIGYYDRAKMGALSPEQLKDVMSGCPPHMKALYATNRVLLVAGVDTQTMRVQRVAGNLELADGPIAGAKERIGGVFIVEAADLDEATRIASLHPTTQVMAGEALGWRQEIRPIHTFDGQLAKT